MPMTRREFLVVAAAAGVASPALTAQDSPRTLLDHAAQPILIEFPGQPARTLRPGAPERSMGIMRAEFPKAPPLVTRQVLREIGPHLLERSIEVLADDDATFNIELPYDFPSADSYYSWHGKVTSRLALVQDVDEHGKPTAGGATQSLPFAGAGEKGNLTGAFGDCPAFWENRAQQIIDPGAHRLSLRTGDGTSAHLVSIIWGDSSGYYRGDLDGWQHIRAGQLRRFRTWLFSAPAPNLYAVQSAVHRAISNALQRGDSDLTGIMRNTSYFLVRRNLLRRSSTRGAMKTSISS
jgi:hypothetical protein